MYNLSGDFMKSIDQNITNEIIINKSRFICCLIKIQKLDDIDINIEKIKQEYKGATHYCYAYILGNLKKCSDDKEPSGTAGLPILNVLEKNELSNILCVVIRYFGGIKLGAGGLVRAYTNSVTSALEQALIKDLETVKKVKLSFSYDNIKSIDNILINSQITNKEFNEFIEYECLIKIAEYDSIKEKLNTLCINIELIEELTI